MIANFVSQIRRNCNCVWDFFWVKFLRFEVLFASGREEIRQLRARFLLQNICQHLADIRTKTSNSDEKYCRFAKFSAPAARKSIPVGIIFANTFLSNKHNTILLCWSIQLKITLQKRVDPILISQIVYSHSLHRSYLIYSALFLESMENAEDKVHDSM